MYLNLDKIKKIFFDLWPLNRSITGKGTLASLKIIKSNCRKFKIKFFRSDTKVFDWKIPKVWEVKEAYIIDPDGKKICDFKKNNLHIVGYSKKVNKNLTLNDLKKNLHSIKKQPSFIPYVTSYYKKNWGFCIEYKKLKKLKKGKYKVKINSSFVTGKMYYGEGFIKGISKKEVFISSYICHPSMANNELSGPIVLLMLYNYLISKKKLYYSYRFVITPETIGSIAFIKKNFKKLKKNVFCGYNLSCIGDKNNFSFVENRNGPTISENILIETLNKLKLKYKKYYWLERGSDERQYSSPHVDLPIITVCRSKFGKFKEYHTSGDILGKTVSFQNLMKSFKVLKKCVEKLEQERIPKIKFACEPFMTKYNLYETISKKNIYTDNNKNLMNIISYCDGKNSVSQISKKCKVNLINTKKSLKLLAKNKIIKFL